MIFEGISDDMPPQMKNFEYGYPYFNALLQFSLVLGVASRIKPHVIQRNVT